MEGKTEKGEGQGAKTSDGDRDVTCRPWENCRGVATEEKPEGEQLSQLLSFRQCQ